MIVAQVRADGRDRVGCVVLGGGAGASRVEHWLRTAAGVDGYLGFAVGRTIWGPAIRDYHAGRVTREAATARISASFRRAIEVSNSNG
jgi:myo-inositol catabolism protein IolC